MKMQSKAVDPTGQRHRKRRCGLAIAFAIAIVVVDSWSSALALPHNEKEANDIINEETQDIEVQLQSGVVRGEYEVDAVVFKGIPYAVPPVGNRRWKPSVLCSNVNECWSGTFHASQFGSRCAQPGPGGSSIGGSEDCLFLNVWTPKKRSSQKLLPVLFYIHGGNLCYGSGDADGLHPPPELVTDIKVVAVSINYRLNALGFLALKSLADASPSKTSGNYGFMDQITALKWVEANIDKFGGDSGSVTLIGGSSGATSELALLASPLAAGLFHRAIIMSGSPVFNKSSEDASHDNEIFVKKSNCTRKSLSAERECLYSLSAQDVEDSIPWFDAYPYWGMKDQNELPTKNLFYGAMAVVDKLVVPNPPLLAMATGKGNDVPIIIGTTAQETDFQAPKNFENSTWAEYRRYVAQYLRPFVGKKGVKKVLRMYNKPLPYGDAPSLQHSYTSMASDIRLTCPNHVVARNASTGFNSPVYRYVVTNRPSKPISFMPGFQATLASHMWDIAAFFGFPESYQYTPSEKDKSFMRDLRREFGKFIHNEPFESWRAYPENTALFTDCGVKVIGKDGYHKKECDFWLDNGFFGYGWIN